ncbi:MAG: hypothetical protein R2939_07405 [Kofleriaceae bacterium]
MTRTLASLALVATLVATGCVDADSADEGGPATAEIEGDDKADGELRVRIDGMTVWFDRAVAYVGGDHPWRLGGRASRNLEGAMSFIPDDRLGEVELLSARTFEVALSSDEMAIVGVGGPLLVQLDPTTGAGATAAVWLSPRLTDFAGSSHARLDLTVTPRWIAGRPTMRGGARTDTGWTLTATGPTAPQIVADAEPSRWILDWATPTFLAGAAAPMTFNVERGAELPGKTARATFVVRRLGVTRLDPYEVWAPRCEAQVRACVAALPAGVVDASACGTFAQVSTCGGPEVAATPSAPRLAADLRAHLVAYYADHGADIVGSGGNDLAAAQAAVDVDGFAEVTDPEEDPFAYDLGATWLFRHADVTFPGSDIVWFLAYDRASGALIEVADFN